MWLLSRDPGWLRSYRYVEGCSITVRVWDGPELNQVRSCTTYDSIGDESRLLAPLVHERKRQEPENE